jgi:hypothetical protein
MSFGIFAFSYRLGTLYKNNKVILAAMAVVVAAVTGGAFISLVAGDMYLGLFPVSSETQRMIAGAMGLLLGLSLYGFARLFASETEEQRNIVREFFKKLDTRVDVAKEVFAAGRRQVSTFPLVGGTTIVMGLLMSLIFFTSLSSREQVTLGTIIGIMMIFGVLMWYFGKKSEIRSAAEYLDKKHDTSGTSSE